MPKPLEPVNDVHSGLNPASMRVHRPGSMAEVQRLVTEAGSLSLCGGRHAMGGQQFCQEGDLLDLRGLNRIQHFDLERGLVTAEAGIQWPELIQGILAAQPGSPRWGIAQKQTGANALTLGARFPPIFTDAAFAWGRLLMTSRRSRSSAPMERCASAPARRTPGCLHWRLAATGCWAQSSPSPCV